MNPALGTPVDFLVEADRVGNGLCREALWSGARCTWLGWTLQPDASGRPTPSYRSFGADLYEGTLGVALFLARLHAHTGDKRQRRAAIGALNQALAVDLDQGPRGFYSGVAGHIYALLELGHALEDVGLHQRVAIACERLRLAAADAWDFDVMDGSAGVIPVLLAAAETLGRDDLVERAAEHGAFLIDAARVSDDGVAWPSPTDPGDAPLLGFSHGASGVAWALAELHAVTGAPGPAHAAREAARYERAHFDARAGNWPDRRAWVVATEGQPGSMLAWCHGAPGIGLARLGMLSCVGEDADLREDLERALVATSASLVGSAEGPDHSLCHGTFGVAELLLLAATQLDRPALRREAEAHAEAAIAHASRGHAWGCGVPGGWAAPGLMLGWAGIGNFLLRLVDHSVPSPLLPCDPLTRRHRRDDSDR
ncbi:lanthionine synthetase LanC family protein [Enhygromyxa salina]|uniref:Lanthionine synthetase C-like protein n=1 Tax=Enhygromyxa salina TaxID=215803 RepID=A0A2S9YSV9_9BACT|nr:lanthionine synthetase LanC family protein [Enhygromyxa salina]PRQ08184.1 Lanthionine synthetase C-like protein [Enhygromyxa salina]